MPRSFVDEVFARTWKGERVICSWRQNLCEALFWHLYYTKYCTVLSFSPAQLSSAHWYHHLMIHALYSSLWAQLGTLNSVVKLINVLLPVISVLRSGVHCTVLWNCEISLVSSWGSTGPFSSALIASNFVVSISVLEIWGPPNTPKQQIFLSVALGLLEGQAIRSILLRPDYYVCIRIG